MPLPACLPSPTNSTPDHHDVCATRSPVYRQVGIAEAQHRGTSVSPWKSVFPTSWESRSLGSVRHCTGAHYQLPYKEPSQNAVARDSGALRRPRMLWVRGVSQHRRRGPSPLHAVVASAGKTGRWAVSSLTRQAPGLGRMKHGLSEDCPPGGLRVVRLRAWLPGL